MRDSDRLIRLLTGKGRMNDATTPGIPTIASFQVNEDGCDLADLREIGQARRLAQFQGDRGDIAANDLHRSLY